MNKTDELRLDVEFMSPMFARADFKPEIFDNVIKQKGVRIIWEQGMLCSCIERPSGQPNYGCPVCKGVGYQYFDAKNTRAVVSSINGKKESDKIGMHEQGSMYLTPMSTDMIGFRDRFTFIDFTVKFSEVLDFSAEDKVRYKVMEVLQMRHLDQVFKPGIDFKILGDGTVEWINEEYADIPKCSILYTTNPRYIAMSPIHELRGTYTMNKGQGLESFVPLPSQFQIKREDFLSEQ